MDKPFADCIKEIESNYVSFPKANRIRIEKWVEKLVTSSDSNPKWRRHRDLYARLLLSMVISKRLDDPFTQLPPDGPLQSFPMEKIYKCKDLLGPRESMFWRQMYNTLTSVSSMKSSALENESSLLRRSFNTPIPGRDVHNLNLIIKEQANRIELLEEKLHEERLRHEMQIRQLIKKYENQLSATNSSVLMSQTDISHTNIRPHNTSILRPSSTFARSTSTDGNRPISPLLQSPNLKNQKEAKPKTYASSVDSASSRSQPTHHTAQGSLPQRRPGRPRLCDIDSGHASAADSEVTDDAISSRLKGHKKEVWMDYMQYLDKFQHEIKTMRS